MNFEMTPRMQDLYDRAKTFIDNEIQPYEGDWWQWNQNPENLWKPWPKMEEIKARARGEGLWNLFLPHPYKDYADGPDEVHMDQLARKLIKRYSD